MSAAPCVTRLLRIERTVADLPRALAFYRDALGFEADDSVSPAPGLHSARLRLGAQAIELVAYAPPGAAYPPHSSAADLWFQHCAIPTQDIAAACERVQAQGARAITQGGAQRLPAAAGGVSAYKFRDPCGHPLELISFPRGVGDPAWQHARGLTQGIDHSAISVGDAERSIAFYAGLLGLRQAARQVNRGAEQERLDGLPGVVVEVVALEPQAAVTPHVELLGYREPRGRAAACAPHDIACDRLVFEVEGLERLVARLHAADVATTAAQAGDAARAVLVRDPDGHLLLLCDAASPDPPPRGGASA